MDESNLSLDVDRTPSNELLADLERHAELRNSARYIEASQEPTVSESALCAEHQRLYRFIDQLTAPVRSAFTHAENPPELPDYDDLEEVGRGGMGIVYRGTHKRMQRVDAIKVIRPDRLKTVLPDTVSHLQQRFEREARLAAQVAHEHIVPVYQVGEIDGRLWFSMQLVAGTTLYHLRKSETLVPESIANYIERIARAVHAVHRQGILHGDIKPQNILIETETNRPLLGDFGLAELYASDMLTPSATVSGTLAFMAPELIEAARRNATPDEIATIRSISTDIYSLGATLMAALTGDSPARLRHPSQSKIVQPAASHPASAKTCLPLTEKLPVELLQICKKAMAEDSSVRHTSAQEVADDIATWLNRPRWNRFFPRLQLLLCMATAPLLLVNGVAVDLMLRIQTSELWISLAIFSAYIPLFCTFAASQQLSRSSEPARRELWAMWIGHAVGSLACFISLRNMLHPNLASSVAAFYPCWAALSSATFFAKSGNFWGAYRWIGATWSVIAVLLSLIPSDRPLVFGVFAALTCILIARGDRELRAT